MNSSRNLIIVAFLACVTLASDELKEWYKNVNDINFVCDQVGEGSEVADDPIFSVVDCDADGARWDYKYQTKGSSKPKKGPFNGRSVLSFARPGGEHGFKYGFKYGKCLKLEYRDSLKSVTGNFVDDKLEGHVLLEFHDDSVVAGLARNNRLVGVIRSFTGIGNADTVRMNMTTVKTGRVLCHQDRFGFLRILSRDEDGKSGRENGNNKTTRIIFTKNFGDMFNCQPTDSYFLEDCRVMDKSQFSVRQCLAYVRNEDVGCDLDGGKKFLYYAPTAKRFELGEKSKSVDDYTFDFCPKSSKLDNSQDIRADFEKWIGEVSDQQNDPFWMVYDPKDAPLDHKNPTIDINLPFFDGRKGFEDRQVRIVSSDNVLFIGNMTNGRIVGKVDEDKVNLSDWRAPLRVELTKPERGANGFILGHGETVHVVEEGRSSLYLSGRIRNGKLHGLVRMFGRMSVDPKAICASPVWPQGLSYIGWYEEGKAVGWAWRGLVGDAWLGGEVDEEGRFSGKNIYYVNQDIRTAYAGEFKNGLMVQGREADVVGSHCQRGIKVLEFSEPRGPEYHYDPPTDTYLGDQPLLGDPLDNRYLYLKQSAEFPIAGEGSHARIDVPAHTTYALYNGYQWDKQTSEKNLERIRQEFADRNITDDLHPEKIAAWKYRHSIPPCGLTLDLPGEFEPTEKYRATLGHKINHKFDPNTVFTYVDSARFGITVALKTKEALVKKDEEFFVSYGYSLGVNLPWYQDAYKEFAKKNPDKVNVEFLKSLTSKGEEGIGAGEAAKEEGEGGGEESVVVENDGTV